MRTTAASGLGAVNKVSKTGDIMSGALASSAAITAGVVVIPDGPVIICDASQGNHFRFTLGGNRTLGTPLHLVDGQKFTLEVIQDGAGSRTLTFGGIWAFGASIPSPVLTTTAGGRDFLGWIYNAITGRCYLAGLAQGF